MHFTGRPTAPDHVTAHCFSVQAPGSPCWFFRPPFLQDHCSPAINGQGRSSLRSTEWCVLIVKGSFINSLATENYSVICAFLSTLELNTPLESGKCVLSAYEIAFLCSEKNIIIAFLMRRPIHTNK